MSANTVIVKNYETSLAIAYDGLIAVLKKSPNHRIPKTHDAYICKHDPCCNCCWFASKEQVDFEDKLAYMIGCLTVTISSIKKNENVFKCGGVFDIRLDHFFSSPKWRVLVSDDGLNVRIDLDSAFTNTHRLLTWCKAYGKQTGRKPVYLGGGKIGVLSFLRDAKTGGDHSLTCSQVMMKVDDEENNYSSGSVYSPKSSIRSPSLSKIDEHPANYNSHGARERKKIVQFETPMAPSQKKGIIRQPTGYVRYHERHQNGYRGTEEDIKDTRSFSPFNAMTENPGPQHLEIRQQSTGSSHGSGHRVPDYIVPQRTGNFSAEDISAGVTAPYQQKIDTGFFNRLNA